MYDLTSILTTIAGCSATIIAIIGGFIASKLIAISTERHEILSHLLEINEEISFKSKRAQEAEKELDEDDALDFIKDNIDSVIYEKTLELIYRKQERQKRQSISVEKLKPYWEKAIMLSKRVCDIFSDEIEETNDDDVPVSIVSTIESDFEYSVCKYAAKFMKKQIQNNLLFQMVSIPVDYLPRHGVFWYQKRKDEINEANVSIQWLEIQKKQLIIRKNALEKPKGMKSGLVVFGLLSLFSIVAPLIVSPFTTDSYCNYLIVKCCTIGIFVIGLFSIFIYLISLLKWKEKDNV